MGWNKWLHIIGVINPNWKVLFRIPVRVHGRIIEQTSTGCPSGLDTIEILGRMIHTWNRLQVLSYLLSKAIGYQWVFLSVCLLTPLKQLIVMNSNVEDDSPTNADGFRLNKLPDSTKCSFKNWKNANDTRDNTNFWNSMAISPLRLNRLS